MKISKITIKYFLNKRKPSSSDIISFDVKDMKEFQEKIQLSRYPLYIQITYKRKSTKIKSLIGLSFSSVNEAFDQYAEYLKKEEILIRTVVLSEIKSEGEKFEIIGISKKLKIYSEKIIDFFEDDYFNQEYNCSVLRTKSIFMRMVYDVFISDRPNYFIEYFDKITELLGNPNDLIQMKHKVPVLKNFIKIFDKDLHEKTIVEWLHANVKEDIKVKAIKKNIRPSEINDLINAINETVEKRLKNNK